MTAAEREEKFSRAILGARYATAILRDVRTGAFELIDADKLPLAEEALQNRSYVGVMGYHEDGIRFALDEDLDAQTLSMLSVRFLKQLEQELNARVIAQVAKRVGDEVEFLNRLHRLPDSRNEGMEN